MNEDLQNALAILQTRLTTAQTKRGNLEIDLRETEAEIANLNQAINRIFLVLGFEQGQPISELGITDAIRRVTKPPQDWMSARQVHEALEKQGFDLSSYENPMASIYKILTRLQEAGELESKKDGWNTFYKTKRRAHAHVVPRRRRTWIARATAEPPPKPADVVPGFNLHLDGKESQRAEEDSLVDQVQKSFGKNVEGSK